jgi:PAS domain S-box-containing protein
MKDLEDETGNEIARLREINRGLTEANESLTRELGRQRGAPSRREEDYRLMVDNMPVGAAIAGPTGAVEIVNRHMLDYFGRPLEELKAWMTTGAQVHREDFERVAAAVRHSWATGQARETEQRLLRHDGVYRWFQVRAFPLRGEDGSIVRWYGAYIDIDDRKRAEEKLAASERNLQVTIDAIPALAWSAGPSGAADFFSQHYLNYVGLPAAQMHEWGWTTTVHPDDREKLAQTWASLMAAGEIGEAEARLRRFDGTYRTFLLRASPLRNADGEIAKWYGVNTDIEDRKRVENELRQTTELFGEALRLTRTGSFITDMDGDEHLWSDEARRIWGFEPNDQLTIATIRERIHPDDLVPFDAAAANSVRAGSVTHDFRIQCAGAIRHVRVAAHAGKRNGRRSYVGAVQDLTDQKLAEAALDHARSELAHAARAMSLGVLTASIAHEVNQPLSGIVTNTSTCLRMLAADPPNLEGARETSRRTLRDGNRASEVISRLRTLFSRRDFAATERIDLNAAAREVLALSAHELQRHEIVVQADFEEDLPPVTGDRVQIQQVIINLLLNASDALREAGKGAPRIRIETCRDGPGCVKLSVQDNGVGLPDGAAARLFEAFYTTKSEGMGIGLSVSHSIIERHRGRLWASSNEDAGATFTFSVPCADTADQLPDPRATQDRTSL